MSDQAASILDRFRKPEYTGENRCLPCTVVNVAIAVVASALVAPVAPLLSAGVFGGSLLAIYLRGYLVPGTPQLTKRYLPDRVLALFDTHPLEEVREPEFEPAADDASAHGGDDEDDDGRDDTWETVEKLEHRRRNAVDPEQFLLEVAAVGPCEDDDVDDLCLTDEFAALVERRADAYADGSVEREALADLFDVESDAVSFEDREYPAIKIDRRIRKWPGDAALVADVATHEALDERSDRWADVPLEQRLEILESLRAFHEVCPLCSSEISLGEETVDSCCRSYQVYMLGCHECEEPLLEFDPKELGASATDTGITP